MFDKIYRKGRCHYNPLMVLRVIEAIPALLPPDQRRRPSANWRCGVVVSTKVSKRAVHRNRIRRLLHAQLLREPPTPQRPIWMVISLKPNSLDLPPPQLLEEWGALLRKAGLTDES